MDEAMERSIFDQEMAIQEITRGYKLVTRLHSILPTGEPQRELIGTLFGEVLQALSTALSILKSSNKSIESSDEQIITETGSASFSDQGSNESSEEVKSAPTTGCGKRGRQERLRTMNPWTKVTYAPHDDGHQWRKYGQKNIQKSKLSRSYYRCTYKGEGCQATKHIQQKDCGDPPLFLVTYYEKHTCESNASPMIISPQITQYPLLQQVQPNLFSFESNANIVSNKEGTMPYSSLKTSTAQKDTELGRDGLQNISINQKSMKSVANSEECLEAMPNTRIEDISASVCMSPSWEVMSMNYWTMTGSFGYDAIDSFSSF
ncbi:hypothetical protein J5N97_017430 [Dioscorea zingiberensis]|uniref:WRKY domain-containing protein n=1 Tax=Dioscorea zingiberensis TaxID=325984 RepID=A0A9D5HGD3_9LILI|nr:hypothetical protein J5N97_017430 [Dioscorea zingiberensis]